MYLFNFIFYKQDYKEFLVRKTEREIFFNTFFLCLFFLGSVVKGNQMSKMDDFHQCMQKKLIKIPNVTFKFSHII